MYILCVYARAQNIITCGWNTDTRDTVYNIILYFLCLKRFRHLVRGEYVPTIKYHAP